MRYITILIFILFLGEVVKAQCTVTVSSPTTAICSGSSVILTASGATTYSWNTGATTSTISVSPTVTTSYSVTGVAGSCTRIATTTITVNTSPTLVISPASPTVCSGSALTLTASGASTYTWNTSATTTTISITPTVNTTYTVTGTSAAGCTNTAVKTVTVANPILVSASASTICSGSSVTLTASGSSTYSWSTGATTASISASPTVTTTYTVKGTTGACVKTLSLTITVNATPTLVISPASPTVCSGSALTLTVSGASTYTWNTSATTTTISITPTVNTTYTVIGTSTAGCTVTAIKTVTVNNPVLVSASASTICSGSVVTLTASGSATYSWSTGATTASISVSPTVTTTYTVKGTTGACVKTLSITITVNATPTLVISPASPTVCSGSALTLTASGASTYTWNTSATTTTISITPTVNTTYTVIGTSAAGCTNTAIKTVTVNNPVLVSASTSTICSGSAVTLTASGAATYSWSTGATTASISVTPTVTTTYTVKGTTGSCIQTLSITVTVNTIPNVLISNPTPTVCSGAPAILTATGATTYSWSTSATTASISVTPTVTTNYTVTGTLNGCIKTATATITVTALPSLTISPLSPTICTGSSVVLTGSGASSYTWNTGATTTTISVTPTVTSNYTLTGTASTGCKNTSVISVTVIPIPTVTIVNPTPTVCIGTPAILTATGATSYTWNTGPTTNSISVTPTVNTNYTVTGQAGGCLKTSTTSIFVNALPSVSISPTSPTLCLGSSITLTASGASTYGWSTGGSGSTITKNPTVNTTFTVIGTSALGCTNTAVKTVTVVNQLQVVSSSPTLCAGGSTTLTASGSTTYTWSTSATTASIVVSPTITTSYSLTGKTGACTTTLAINILANPLPVINFSSATQSVCLGSAAILSPIGAVNYTWSTGATTESISVTPTVTSTYTVTGISIFGCIKTATTTVYPVCPLNYGGVGYKVKWKNYYGSMRRNDSLLQDPTVTVPEVYPSAISKNTLLGGTNGWVEQVVGSTPSTNYFVGFLDSASTSPGDYFDIDFGIYVAGVNDLYVSLNGSITYLGSASAGDVLRLERTGSNYFFKKNSVGIYTTTANPASNIKVKAIVNNSAIYNIGSSFADSTNVYFANYVKPNRQTIHTNDGTPYGITVTDGGLTLSPKPGESNFTYTWSPGATTGPSISNKGTGFFNVRVKDGLQNISQYYNLEINYKTYWDFLSAIAIKGDTVTSLDNPGYAWCTTVADNVITSRTDGYVRWKIQDIASETKRIIGFTPYNKGYENDYKDIGDGIYQYQNQLYYVSYGSFTFLGYCLPEDEMKMQRVGTTFYCYRNTTSIYKKPFVLDTNKDWYVKVAMSPFTELSYIGITWPAPYRCSAYNIQINQPLFACKNAATAFTAQLKLFTTNVTPTAAYTWLATPAQTGSFINGTLNNTFNILNATAGFNLAVNNTYASCAVSNNFNITVSNLTANAGPDGFISSFPSLSFAGGGSPSAIGGTTPYSYNWVITPSGVTTTPPSLSGVSNFAINPISASYGTTPYTANLTVTDALGCTATDAFSVYDISVLSNQKIYAILKKKLDAGYYNTVLNSSQQTLFFMFDEEYYKPGSANNLTYSIVDDNNNALGPYTSPSLIKKIGDNRFGLIVSSVAPPLTPTAFYKIFVKNEKNEVWQARFKVN